MSPRGAAAPISLPALVGNEQSWSGPHSVYWTAVPSSASTWFATFVVLAILIVWPSTCRAPPEIWAELVLARLAGLGVLGRDVPSDRAPSRRRLPLGVHGRCTSAGRPGLVARARRRPRRTPPSRAPRRDEREACLGSSMASRPLASSRSSRKFSSAGCSPTPSSSSTTSSPYSSRGARSGCTAIRSILRRFSVMKTSADDPPGRAARTQPRLAGDRGAAEVVVQRGLDERVAELVEAGIDLLRPRPRRPSCGSSRRSQTIRFGAIAYAPTISAASVVAEFMSPVTPFEFSRSRPAHGDRAHDPDRARRARSGS